MTYHTENMTTESAAIESESVPELSPELWVAPQVASAEDMDFSRAENEAIRLQVCLNYLFNLTELAETKFNHDILRKLINKTTLFAVTQKTTAQHLPLPRREFTADGYDYHIYGHIYKAADITPGFHASPKFYNDNRDNLPAGDFRPGHLVTKVNKKEKTISAQFLEYSAGIIPKTARKIKELTFDNISRDVAEPWRISIWNDDSSVNKYWIHIVIRAAEKLQGRREHGQRYSVEIECNEKEINDFIEELELVSSNCQTPTERHRLLSYLVATLYFQSDPQRPYICPDFIPHTLNEKGPYDLHDFPSGGNGIRKIPPLINSVLSETDGFVAINNLYNEGSRTIGRKMEIEETIKKLKRIFGEKDYEKLAKLVQSGMSKTLKDILEKVEHQIENVDRQHAEFNGVWLIAENKLTDLLSNAIKIVFKNIKNNKLKEMMEWDNLLGVHVGKNTISQTASLDQRINDLIRDLVLSTMLVLIDKSINTILEEESFIGQIIKKYTVQNNFLQAWTKIKNDINKEFSITPEAMDNILLSRFIFRDDKKEENKVLLMFKSELNKAKRKKLGLDPKW